MPSRSAYKGRRQKLVLAFDIGTSYSGISYSVLNSGEVPEIKGVTRFPAHEQVNGALKIPTIIYYDRSGKVRAVGAEAASEVIYMQAEEEKWVKTVVEVFGDFLAYLFKCASSYIQETHANGAVLWESVKDEIDFVLSHPNGWEGTEQSEMRKAAIRGGLIPDTSAGHARLSFVTEGEASLHFAIQNGLPEGAMKNGDGVIIVDAGGGTIDVGSYSRNVSASKVVFEEMTPPRSHFYGSVFVSIHARQFLQNYLAESPFVDDIDHIVHCFDKTTKQRFITAEDDQYVKFGSTRDNDAVYNIRFGQLKLLGIDIASFFKPSIDCIIKAVLEQKMTSAKPISHVVLVGGFAANNYMFNLVHAALEPAGFNILRPDSHVSKAVSDGAVSFYLDHFVQSRVPNPMHGNFCNASPSSYSGSTCDKQEELMLEQRQQINATSRSNAAKDYAAAVGGTGRQAGLLREPRQSFNAQEPPPPPRSSRSVLDSSQQTVNTSYLRQFLPSYTSSVGGTGRQAVLLRDPRQSSNAQEPPPPPRSSRSVLDSSRQPINTSYLRKFLPSYTSSSDPAREEEFQRLYAEHQRMQSDLKRAESENRHLRHANRELDQERARHRENAATLQNELRNMQRELEDYRNLSEIRGKELLAYQTS